MAVNDLAVGGSPSMAKGQRSLQKGLVDASFPPRFKLCHRDVTAEVQRIIVVVVVHLTLLLLHWH
jgi:hypothetical protein